MKIEIEYKDLMFLKDYITEQAQDLDKRVKESYMDEETPLDEISSLGKTRDTLNIIASVIKKQI
jgi:broad specificity phosphatase PhoE